MTIPSFDLRHFSSTQLVNVAVSKSPTKTNVKESRATLTVTAVSSEDIRVTMDSLIYIISAEVTMLPVRRLSDSTLEV